MSIIGQFLINIVLIASNAGETKNFRVVIGSK